MADFNIIDRNISYLQEHTRSMIQDVTMRLEEHEVSQEHTFGDAANGHGKSFKRTNNPFAHMT